jgi:pimeloyl-ACP methyl ester carboxylesterase
VRNRPETRYVKSGELNIGYQVLGEGAVDLVFVPGLFSHLDSVWNFPASTDFFHRLASFSRLILYDKRGQGISDPPARVATLEDDMQDLGAVLDAVGSQRAALFGFSEGGPMSALFAATFPYRVSRLILFGTFARGADVIKRLDELGWRAPAEVEEVLDHWGEGRSLAIFAPSIAPADAVPWFAALERSVGSPRMLRGRYETSLGIDATPVLGTLRVPVLVIHRAGDRAVPSVVAREMARRIPTARYVEVPGIDHLPWVGDAEQILADVEEFLTGARHAADIDRVLATVMFTDIVDSTRRAAELGDVRWRSLLDSHNDLVREVIGLYHGREVKTTGDGFLVTFDGPARGIHCARAIVQRVPSLDIEVRAGLHTGELELVDHDVSGVAVNIGARIGAMAAGGEVLVSSTVKDLVVGSGIEFRDRGLHELKGVPGQWHVFAVTGNRR